MDMGVPFGERGKAEVLSAMKNKRKRCCGHGGGLLFYALFCTRMVTFVCYHMVKFSFSGSRPRLDC